MLPGTPGRPGRPFSPVVPVAPVAPSAPVSPFSPRLPFKALIVAGFNFDFPIDLFFSFLPATELFLMFLPLIRPDAAVAEPPTATNRARRATMVVNFGRLVLLMAFILVSPRLL